MRTGAVGLYTYACLQRNIQGTHFQEVRCEVRRCRQISHFLYALLVVERLIIDTCANGYLHDGEAHPLGVVQ